MSSPLDTLPEAERLAAFDNLAARALDAWGVKATSLRRIACRENAVYAVDCGDGRQVALRVHRHGYHTRESLLSEFTWARALGEVGVATAKVIPTASGDSMVEVTGAGIPVPHLCDMLEWVEGRPLGLVEDPATLGHEAIFESFRTVGSIAGRIHLHSARWQPPAGFVRPHWDHEGCLGPGALWGPWYDLEVLEDEERRTLQAAAGLVQRALQSYGQSREVYGLVHADFVPDNLFEHEGRIVVLDFDDAGYGWYLWELVTAVFWYLGTPHYTAALDGYLAGYREVRPFPQNELQLLPHFLLMRALVYMGWMHTRRTQRTARLFTTRVRELSLALAERLLAGESEFRWIELLLTPLPEEA